MVNKIIFKINFLFKIISSREFLITVTSIIKFICIQQWITCMLIICLDFIGWNRNELSYFRRNLIHYRFVSRYALNHFSAFLWIDWIIGIWKFHTHTHRATWNDGCALISFSLCTLVFSLYHIFFFQPLGNDI